MKVAFPKRRRLSFRRNEPRLWPFGAALAAGFATAIVGLVALTWLAWLLLHRPSPPHPGTISLHDAVSVIQLVFASVAGSGALVALIVAYRKQKIAEADSAHDRTRVFNERFTTIATQLGDESPAVRLAAVHAMAGLADDWESNRQTCIDVLCAYLRMPYEPDPEDDAPTAERLTFQSNREVRHTVIRIITAHLKDDASVSWQGRNFDFTGVSFDGGDFRGARFTGGDVSFRGAVFADRVVYFDGAQFTGGTVNFNGARFASGGVHFTLAKFAGASIHFNGAHFTGGTASFVFAKFTSGTVDFSAAKFISGTVFLNGAEFTGSTADFGRAKFIGGTVNFSNAIFANEITGFREADFDSGIIDFSLAKFTGGTVDFRNAKFKGSLVRFDSTEFVGGTVSFSLAKFTRKTVHFSLAKFTGGTVDFRNATFKGGAIDFSNVSEWSCQPKFDEPVPSQVKLPPGQDPANGED